MPGVVAELQSVRSHASCQAIFDPHVPVPTAPVHLFTDGSGSAGPFTCLRKASWAFIWADDHDFRPSQASCKRPCAQACLWAHHHGVPCHIWVDCQHVLERLRALQQGEVPDLKWANADIWLDLKMSGALQGLRSVTKVHSHQLPAHGQPGHQWAQRAIEHVDLQGRLALSAWLPGEQPLCQTAHEQLAQQQERLRHLTALHLASAEQYTGGTGATNRPPRADALEARPEINCPPLPPSLRRHGDQRSRQPTLFNSLGKRPAGAPHPDEPGGGRPRRMPPDGQRAGLQLAQTPLQLDIDQHSRLAWKEVVPLDVVREVLPFLTHAWEPTAAPQWLSWLDLLALFYVRLHRRPPAWHRERKQFVSQQLVTTVPSVETIKAMHDGLRYALEPALLHLGLRPASPGLRPSNGVQRHAVPLVPWRARRQHVEETSELLYQWFPQGVGKVQDLEVVRPWPARNEPVPWANVGLFPEGVAANRPWKRPRRRV